MTDNIFGTARPYAAAYIILRRDNKVAFILRHNAGWMNGYYGVPAGKVEIAESCGAAAIREAKEEVGIVIDTSHLRHALTVHRLGDDKLEWIDVYFEVTSWEGEPYNAEPDIHSELAWLDLDNLPENIIPSVRFGLEQVTAGKTYAEYGWSA